LILLINVLIKYFFCLLYIKDRDTEQTKGDDGKDQSASKSVIQNMFSFMKRGNTHESEAGGIYLDDVNFENMDPKVAELYFPNLEREVQRLVLSL